LFKKLGAHFSNAPETIVQKKLGDANLNSKELLKKEEDLSDEIYY